MLNGRVLQIFERKMPNNNYNDKENVDSTFAKLLQLNETTETSPSAFVRWLKTELDVETVEDLVEAVTDCSDTMVAGGVKDCFEDVFRDGIINMGKNKEQYNNRALRRPQNTIFLKGMTFGTVNAMAAADSILVPMQCEYYALEGLTALMDTITQLAKLVNPNLQIEGILRTMYDPRNRLANDVSEQLKQHFGDKVYRTKPKALPSFRALLSVSVRTSASPMRLRTRL